MDPSARISNHPVLLHKLTLLRDATTAPHDFRALLSELTFYLGCVARQCARVAIVPPATRPAEWGCLWVCAFPNE